MRSTTIPQKEFQKLNLNFIENICFQFYRLYEKVLGVSNCTYNTHVFVGHLLDIRTHGPLTLTSAFGFENFYGEMRHSFTPGTPSPLKQIFEKVLIKRVIGHHACKIDIMYATYDTELECNSLIYTFKSQKYHIYRVTSINEEERILSGVEIFTKNAHFPETPNIKWNEVGVFEYDREDSQTVHISSKDICGKVLKVLQYLVTCGENILSEK